MRPVNDAPIARVERHELADGKTRVGSDSVVREEPMEIRIGGVPIAVIMRTPGHDFDLARGFLVGEGVITGVQQVASMRHCDVVETPEAEDNVVQVVLTAGVNVDLAALRRNFFAGSSCGICGKATIESALQSMTALPDADWRLDAGVLGSLPDALRAAQVVFSETGGSHAAALFTRAGDLRVVREDVGRHNAVDKVVGWALACEEPLAGRVLMVSGRVSYEIAQKAVAARIPAVCAVSAASSLAIDLAREANLTLISFVRGDRMCVYAGEQRLSAPAPT